MYEHWGGGSIEKIIKFTSRVHNKLYKVLYKCSVTYVTRSWNPCHMDIDVNKKNEMKAKLKKLQHF